MECFIAIIENKHELCVSTWDVPKYIFKREKQFSE